MYNLEQRIYVISNLIICFFKLTKNRYGKGSRAVSIVHHAPLGKGGGAWLLILENVGLEYRLRNECESKSQPG